MSNKKILLICCLFFIIFVCNSTFAYKPSHSSSRFYACKSNIRVIQGAIEMYNKDAKVMMEQLDSESMKKLLKEKYLREEPVKPDISCEYKSIGDLSDDGFVFCTYHGDLEQIVYSPYLDQENSDNQYEKYEKLPQNATVKEFNNKKEFVISERNKAREQEEKDRKAKHLKDIIALFISIIMIITIVFLLRSNRRV